jgi:hypothetical protein
MCQAEQEIFLAAIAEDAPLFREMRRAELLNTELAGAVLIKLALAMQLTFD